MTLFSVRPAGSDLESLSAVNDVRRLRGILHSAGDAFVGMDGAGAVTEWNRAAESLFGWLRTEALGRSVAELIVPERLRLAHNDGVHRYLMTGQGPVLGKPVETRAARKDGTEVHIELTRWALEGSEEPEFYAFIRDVTSRVEAEFAATHDVLTGLANMSLLVRYAERRFAESAAGDYRPTLILLDIDRFKRVNDEFGRTVGDDVLRQLARHITDIAQQHAPGQAMVARLSGDQFAILLDDLPAADDLTLLVDLLMAAACQVVRTSTHDLLVTSSVGVSGAEGALEYDVETIMRSAQNALELAQRVEGNSRVLFDERLRWQSSQRKAREHELAIGIEKNQLEVHYQPYFALDTGIMSGAEALVRWRHPAHGLLAPAEFIDIAEQTGLIVPLGRWVLRAVCRQLAQWQHDPALGQLRVAVNFSAHQFAESDPVAGVTEALALAGMPHGGQRLTIEVTESVLIDRPDAVAAALAGLRGLGASVAIDDFGTGYSSLAYLKELPLDVIKIDKSFIDGLPDSRPDRAIVISTIALAHELGFTVIAEGVETAAQRDALLGYGADAVQGFLLARPQPAADIERLFRRVDPTV
ncbi:MAG: EAL domain-containing protein [Nakamurella sp.]